MSLLEHISQPVDDLGFDPRRAGLQRQELAAMYRKQYDQKLRRARLVAHLITGLGLAVFLVSFALMVAAKETRTTCLASTFATIGYMLIVLGKIGLWVPSMKINTLRAIKDLELQVAELADAFRSQAGTTQPPQNSPATQSRR
jgi:hypothetical protein